MGRIMMGPGRLLGWPLKNEAQPPSLFCIAMSQWRAAAMEAQTRAARGAGNGGSVPVGTSARASVSRTVEVVAQSARLRHEARGGQVDARDRLEQPGPARQARPRIGRLEVRERGEVFGECVGFVLEAADGDAHTDMVARGSMSDDRTDLRRQWFPGWHRPDACAKVGAPIARP